MRDNLPVPWRFPPKSRRDGIFKILCDGTNLCLWSFKARTHWQMNGYVMEMKQRFAGHEIYHAARVIGGQVYDGNDYVMGVIDGTVQRFGRRLLVLSTKGGEEKALFLLEIPMNAIRFASDTTGKIYACVHAVADPAEV